MAVDLVWRVPSRNAVEEALYVTLRMMHVGGWAHLLVAVDRRGATWCAVQLAPDAREDDAQTWAASFGRRYRVDTTIAELLADASRFTELYLDGGAGAFLNNYETVLRDREALRRASRR